MDHHKKIVRAIRQEKDKEKRNRIKADHYRQYVLVVNLQKETMRLYVKHSGLICLDFDGYENR